MLAAALVCCLLSPAQDSRAFIADHLRCVRAERRAALFEVLADVDAAGQTALCSGILARQPAGLGAAATVSLRDIARATRELQGLPWSKAQSLADSLDLSLQLNN